MNRKKCRNGKSGYDPAYDVKYTPAQAVAQIVNEIDWSRVNSVCEPCRGAGAIYNAIPEGVTKFWYEIEEGRDYLDPFEPLPLPRVDLVLTNPPFSIWVPFARQALSHAKTVCFLLPVQKLEGTRKSAYPSAPFFAEHEIDKLIIAGRHDFDGRGGDNQPYAWFVWGDTSIFKNQRPICRVDYMAGRQPLLIGGAS